MLKYLLALLVVMTAPAAWAVDWQFLHQENYMDLAKGDDHFYLGCYPSGISMEYYNAKEIHCFKETGTCTSDIDYDDNRTKPITVITDEGNLSLTRSGPAGATIPLGYLDMATYKGEKDEEALGAFARSKKIELVFPAISRHVTFDNIQNGNTLVAFFNDCIQKAIAFEKQQAELRKQLEERQKQQSKQ